MIYQHRVKWYGKRIAIAACTTGQQPPSRTFLTWSCLPLVNCAVPHTSGICLLCLSGPCFPLSAASRAFLPRGRVGHAFQLCLLGSHLLTECVAAIFFFWYESYLFLSAGRSTRMGKVVPSSSSLEPCLPSPPMFLRLGRSFLPRCLCLDRAFPFRLLVPKS